MDSSLHLGTTPIPILVTGCNAITEFISRWSPMLVVAQRLLEANINAVEKDWKGICEESCLAGEGSDTITSCSCCSAVLRLPPHHPVVIVCLCCQLFAHCFRRATRSDQLRRADRSEVLVRSSL